MAMVSGQPWSYDGFERDHPVMPCLTMKVLVDMIT